jgi:hypothetical protein
MPNTTTPATIQIDADTDHAIWQWCDRTYTDGCAFDAYDAIMAFLAACDDIDDVAYWLDRGMERLADVALDAWTKGGR